MPGKLRSLHSQLAALRRRRLLLRWGTAWSGLLLALLWMAAASFLFDWQLEPGRSVRIVLLVLLAIGTVWAFRRFALPWLGNRETELDMALLVEGQQRIDSDLVAALQFERPEASRWGSAQLQTAVIDYVAEFGRELNVFEGLSTKPLKQRGTMLALTALAVFAAVLAFPGHARAWADRMLLGAAHYPTRTVIERIAVNQRQVFPPSAAGGPLKSAYWEPLAFQVHCSGELPPEGLARLTGRQSGLSTEVALRAVEGQPGAYAGQLERMVDSVSYQLYLGDAWTDPALVQVIPLPVVEIDLQVIPPTYAAAAEEAVEAPSGARQIAVVEGSQVIVRATSDKPLRSAVLRVGEQDIPLTRTKEVSAGSSPPKNSSETWILADKTTPLAAVIEPLRYQLQVVDWDGLSLTEPIRGYIRIKADRPPVVTAALVTQYVLPTAQPSISYGATDDYGIASVRILRQVVRAGNQTTEAQTTEDTVEVASPGGSQKLARGEFPLELVSLGLQKGDQLRLVFEAVDYRGSREGKAAVSQPLVLYVTDERGVLAAMVESDQRSARQLDAIIRRQLGIGETP